MAGYQAPVMQPSLTLPPLGLFCFLKKIHFDVIYFKKTQLIQKTNFFCKGARKGESTLTQQNIPREVLHQQQSGEPHA